MFSIIPYNFICILLFESVIICICVTNYLKKNDNEAGGDEIKKLNYFPRKTLL